MGLVCCPGEVMVRLDGEYDYVDRETQCRRSISLEQLAVHSMPVGMLKHRRRRRWGNLLKDCDAVWLDPLANALINSARNMAAKVAEEPDMLDSQWPCPKPKWDCTPLNFLLQDADATDTEALIRLAHGVQCRLEEEPTLLQAPVPTRIFGDLHGQFRDLLLWLQDFGFPHTFGPAFVFNGDWVDRGAHQLETVALIFALKLAFPRKIFLVRGNHEFRDQNVHMGNVGFKAACETRLGQQHGEAVFEAFQAAFDMLPLGCLIAKKILVVHGGLGDGEWTLEYLANVKRPITPCRVTQDLCVYNVLWSDPIPETVEKSFGVHDSPRDGHQRMILSFGKDVTEAFCTKNNLEMVVRSHQEKLGGCGYEVMHGNRLVRVFSARDYEGHGNDGAALKVRRSHGSKLVVRPQLLRSITKVRGVAQMGKVAEPPVLESLCCGCEAFTEAGPWTGTRWPATK